MVKKGNCRDCQKCTERGIVRLTKKVGNAALIVGTLGASVVGAKAISAGRQNCPICGHPMTMHAIVDGHFKD